MSKTTSKQNSQRKKMNLPQQPHTDGFYLPPPFDVFLSFSRHRQPGQGFERGEYEVPCRKAGQEELRWNLRRGQSTYIGAFVFVWSSSRLICAGLHLTLSLKFEQFSGLNRRHTRTPVPADLAPCPSSNSSRITVAVPTYIRVFFFSSSRSWRVYFDDRNEWRCRRARKSVCFQRGGRRRAVSTTAAAAAHVSKPPHV